MTTQEKLIEETLESVNARFETAQPQRILEWADKTFGPRMAVMSSFGLEDVALWDMMWKINRDASIKTLDTFRLPTETYSLMDRITTRYGVKIDVFFPDVDLVEDMVKEKGFNLFYRGVENRKMCCGVRKVEPLNRALMGLDAWVTGLRRDQGMNRGDTAIVEWEHDRGMYKINPLSNWGLDQVWDYVRQNDVPYNELHDKGFPSIGCAPCTRAVAPGEDPRAGRWWWEADPNAKECGLHIG